MWELDEISIEIEDVEARVVMVRVTTPVGVLSIIGDVVIDGDVLRLEAVHLQGLGPGDLGRAGLNAVARKLLVEVDVREVIIQGGTRTTGRNAGRKPKRIRFQR